MYSLMRIRGATSGRESVSLHPWVDSTPHRVRCEAVSVGGSSYMPRGLCTVSPVPPLVATKAAPLIDTRGKRRAPLELQVGSVLHGYTVEEVTPVPERNVVAYRLRHLRSGAEHLHIDCEDSNNVFCVAFKTIPRDSTGVAHVLEHTALCGSRRFPVRDPFYNMLKRSLNTFMNAMTGPDYTMYPFSTQNEKDYTNLLSVYLDAAFFPNLEEIDFMQEGHRLEFETADDSTSRLLYKGVVFNEMKGSMSDPHNLFYHRLHEALYPNTTYAFNSGGEPRDIPKLTHQQLKEFHRIHYHPSNSRFFTYGDLPLTRHLEFINSFALSQFDQMNPQTEVQNVERYDSPKRIELTCPPSAMAGDPNRQVRMCVAVLTNKINDSFETFCMSLLSSLLLEGPTSPMYAALIESNIGSDYAPATGYSPAQEASFGVGLMGISEDDIIKVENIIQETLQKVAQEGFPQERIDSILHQIEIGQKHVTANFGMKIIQGILYPWIHKGAPVDSLLINQHIAKLKKCMSEGPLFQDLVQKYFLNNPHKVTLIMRPDPDFVKNEAEQEKRELQALQGQLGSDEKERIVAMAKKLQNKQESFEDVSCLPTLKLEDIPRESEKVELIKKSLHDMTLMLNAQPTNGIIYFKALMELADIPEKLLKYVPLFTTVLGQLGTKSRDHRALAQKIELYTGGIGFDSQIIVNPADLKDAKAYIYLTSMALKQNSDEMFTLLAEIMNETVFNSPELLLSIIAQSATSLQDSLMSSGNTFAQLHASSSFSNFGHLEELWNGISQVAFMQELFAKAQQQDFEEIIAHLKELSKIIFGKGFSRSMITSEPDTLNCAERGLELLLRDVTSEHASRLNVANAQRAKVPLTKKTYIPLPSSVNYVVQSFPTVPFVHPDSPRLDILSHLMKMEFLHKEIREKGGAYGGGASSGTGTFSYYSYRDPEVSRTLGVFSKALPWIKSNKFSNQSIEETKLGVFSKVDSPRSPSLKGVTEFMTGISHEVRQQRRIRLFETSREDLLEVAGKYLGDGATSSIAVVGSDQNINLKEDQSWHWMDKME